MNPEHPNFVNEHPNFVNVQSQHIIANLARSLGRHVTAPMTDRTSWVALKVLDLDTGWTADIEWGDHLDGAHAKLTHAPTGRTSRLYGLDLADLEYLVQCPDVAAEVEHMARKWREGGAA